MVKYVEKSAITDFSYVDQIRRLQEAGVKKKCDKLRAGLFSPRQRIGSQNHSSDSCFARNEIWNGRTTSLFYRSSPQRVDLFPGLEHLMKW